MIIPEPSATLAELIEQGTLRIGDRVEFLDEQHPVIFSSKD